MPYFIEDNGVKWTPKTDQIRNVRPDPETVGLHHQNQGEKQINPGQKKHRQKNRIKAQKNAEGYSDGLATLPVPVNQRIGMAHHRSRLTSAKSFSSGSR